MSTFRSTVANNLINSDFPIEELMKSTDTDTTGNMQGSSPRHRGAAASPGADHSGTPSVHVTTPTGTSQSQSTSPTTKTLTLDLPEDAEAAGKSIKTVNEETVRRPTLFQSLAASLSRKSLRPKDKEETPSAAMDLRTLQTKWLAIDDGGSVVMINPKAAWKICWDILILALDFFCYFVTPIALIYEGDAGTVFRPLPRHFDPVGLLIDVVFLADIALTFFTISLDSSVSLAAHRYNYCRFWLWLHLTSVLPSAFLPAFRLLRVFDLFRLWQHFRWLLKSSGNVFLYLLVRLAASLLLMGLMLHLFGSFWMVLGLNERGSWIDGFDTMIRKDEIVNQMTYAYYFMMTLFTTVGYGEIFPKTIVEYWFALFSQICGLLLVGYLVAVCTSIVLAMGQDSFNPPEFKLKQELIYWLSQFGTNITQEESQEVLWYFKRPGEGYKYLRDQKSSPLLHSFFSHLPPSVRMKLAVAVYGDFVDKFEAFLEAIDATDGFVEDLLLNLHQRYYRMKKDGDAVVVVPLGEQLREVIFLTEGIALVTAENAEETQKGLQVEGGFWFGGHQCTEEYHPSPIQVEALDPNQSIVAHYIDMWKWRAVLERHPTVARNIIELSKKQTIAILQNLKVPEPTRYTCGVCLLQCFRDGLGMAGMGVSLPFPVTIPVQKVVKEETQKPGEEPGTKVEAAIGAGETDQAAVAQALTATGVQINGLLLPYHVGFQAPQQHPPLRGTFNSSIMSPPASSMWGHLTLDTTLQGTKEAEMPTRPRTPGQVRFLESSQRFAQDLAGTNPLSTMGARRGLEALPEDRPITPMSVVSTTRVIAQDPFEDIPLFEGYLPRVLPASTSGSWSSANRLRRVQQAYTVAAHRGFGDAASNKKVKAEIEKLTVINPFAHPSVPPLPITARAPPKTPTGDRSSTGFTPYTPHTYNTTFHISPRGPPETKPSEKPAGEQEQRRGTTWLGRVVGGLFGGGAAKTPKVDKKASARYMGKAVMRVPTVQRGSIRPSFSVQATARPSVAHIQGFNQQNVYQHHLATTTVDQRRMSASAPSLIAASRRTERLSTAARHLVPPSAMAASGQRQSPRPSVHFEPGTSPSASDSSPTTVSSKVANVPE
ncbi:unnamed protein product [Vitrella brassicaformis CCMP3155]|uniref:Ion transport domain-containing protein n=2 Tax=Vitrella brassicaformis TaxID=1169539 RepID=A0A0G4EVE5_VITBC|nr:unnamed protein product [Vitrella brassicaformis CCMP3155]|eukprot:CEM02596.1 unnamed protein product [Vitrella brassicaformis CCMP3155]